MEGEGTYTYKSGDVYSGSFKEGKKDGAGVYHCKVGAADLAATCRELCDSDRT
jgi:hypothetical protein